MGSEADLDPFASPLQTSQASSALTSLSSSSSSGALDMDVVEEPAAVGTVKQKPSRRGGKGVSRSKKRLELKLNELTLLSPGLCS